MKPKVGSYRVVFIVGRLAFKFPIIRLRTAIEHAWDLLCEPRFILGGLKAEWSECDYESYGSFKHFLFHGPMNNWMEYRFYRDHPDMDFLMPTYFSLFGLANIQQAGIEELVLSPGEMMGIYNQDKVIVRRVFDDGHTFTESHNFCLTDNGEPRIIDYASTGSQTFLREFGYQMTDLMKAGLAALNSPEQG